MLSGNYPLVPQQEEHFLAFFCLAVPLGDSRVLLSQETSQTLLRCPSGASG